MSLAVKTLLDKSIPPLTRSEERKLIKKYRAGDMEAREKLINSCLRFVVKATRGYSGFNLESDDYLQAGVMGLMRAIDSIDLKRNCRLTTVVGYAIKGRVTDLRRTGPIIHVPYKARSCKVTTTSIPDNFDIEAKSSEHVELWFMKHITAKERKVIECMFYKNFNLPETGELFGLSRERIRQIRENLFWRIRKAEATGRTPAERIRILKTSSRVYSTTGKHEFFEVRRQVDQHQ